MAKLLVRCMGQASSPNIKNLYKDGKQNVAWDNTGYRRSSAYTSDGGATLNEGNMTLIMPPSVLHCRSIITDNVIDLSEYSSLNVVYAYNGAEHVKTLNISSISGSGYIVLQTLHFNEYHQFGVSVSLQKTDYGTNLIADSVEVEIGNYNVTVSRVWLEK